MRRPHRSGDLRHEELPRPKRELGRRGRGAALLGDRPSLAAVMDNVVGHAHDNEAGRQPGSGPEPDRLLQHRAGVAGETVGEGRRVGAAAYDLVPCRGMREPTEERGVGRSNLSEGGERAGAQSTHDQRGWLCSFDDRLDLCVVGDSTERECVVGKVDF